MRSRALRILIACARLIDIIPQSSLVLLPSTHPLHDDARRAGKHQKKYGNVYRASACSYASFSELRAQSCSPFVVHTRAAAEDESRPTHLLHASMPKVKEFIASKIPQDALLRRPAPESSSGASEGGNAPAALAATASGDKNGSSSSSAGAAAAEGGDVVMNGMSTGNA